MRIITLHCDYIKFKAVKKAIKNAEELKNKEEQKVEEVLVVLTAVEKGDNDKTVKQLIEAVKKTANDVKTKNIVLYPYAHLSSNLSNPDTALEYMTEAENTLRSEGYSVTRAPFGHYKQFELKCKGHPLAELSKEFRTEISHVHDEKNKIGKLAVEKVEDYDPKQLLREISRSKLDTSKLKDNDHRILGQRLDLFSFHDVAPGMVFWHNNGLRIYNQLVTFWREEHQKAGYQEIKTPQIMDSKIWKISGHWDKYRENNFTTLYENRPFLVKPMNCPGGMLVFKANSRSYKEMPLRVGEIGVVHRTELSGVLNGLFRLIQFTQDDAHIFCSHEEQTEEEIINIAKLIQEFYKKFDLKFDHVELSTRPEKRIGSDETWDRAEKMLEKALKTIKIKYKVNKGDGAFYGPKIDFHVKDSLERTWQLSTIQLDFAMPERFDLEYTDKDNTKKRPIMLHRVIYGSIERFIGILLEHTNGALPLWLSPLQVRVINFTDRNIKSAEKIVKDFEKELPNLRIDSDFRSTTVSDKVRDAEMQKIPIIIVIGDKEEENKTLAVRERGSKPKFGVKFDKLIEEIKERIEKRK
ncbi:MAG: threonine--tRNA ligase [Nanoarchaeota archaeon]|nr:threonine--tRNA ligase [Nanoarchaeota archaeon]